MARTYISRLGVLFIIAGSLALGDMCLENQFLARLSLSFCDAKSGWHCSGKHNPRCDYAHAKAIREIYGTNTKVYDKNMNVYDTKMKVCDTTIKVYDTKRDVYDTNMKVYYTKMKGYDTKMKVYDTKMRVFDTTLNVYDTNIRVYYMKIKVYDWKMKKLTMFTYGSDTSTSIVSTWKMDQDWENYIESSTILWEKNDSRLIECAILCAQDPSCISFFHHPTLKMCLGSQSYKRGLPANQTTQQGWKYYSQPQHCVGDYVYNQTLGLCYKLYEIEMYYKQAMALCERDGAKLLIINNTAEFQHFTRMIGALLWTWVGLQGKSNTPSVFTWWNGQVASNISWFAGFPKHGYDSGVHLFNGHYLNKRLSTPASSALCQRLI